MLTEEDCRRYARWWYQSSLDSARFFKQVAGLRPDLASDINDEYLQTRDKIADDIIKELNTGVIKRVELEATIALTEDGRADEADENSPEFRKLCSYMLRGALEAIRCLRAEEQGDYAYETKDPMFKTDSIPTMASPPLPVEATPIPSTVSGPSIETLIDPFVNEKESAGIGGKTLADYRASLALFNQVVGVNRSVASITGQDVVRFKDLLRQCPLNFRKRLNTDNLEEAIRLNTARPGLERLNTLSPKSINEKYLSNLKAFFDWAKENRHIETSPAAGVRVQHSKRREAVEERDPFSVDDLKKIFNGPVFTKELPASKIHRFWVPIVALFTGMRLSEIGQLHTTDIEELNDIKHFAIRSDGANRRLKTAAARRWVPIHSELVALGFLDYVNRQKSGRLFPGWAMSGDGYFSSAFSKWFSRQLMDCGVKTDKKSFHSFRHSFADALDEVVEASVRDKFMGHASGSVRDRYGSKPPKRAWSEAFLQMSYPGLDLSHLRRLCPA